MRSETPAKKQVIRLAAESAKKYCTFTCISSRKPRLLGFRARVRSKDLVYRCKIKFNTNIKFEQWASCILGRGAFINMY